MEEKKEGRKGERVRSVDSHLLDAFMLVFAVTYVLHDGKALACKGICVCADLFPSLLSSDMRRRMEAINLAVFHD